MLRVENVRCWGIIDDDGVFQVASDLGEVLDVISLVIIAAFSEKPVMDNLMNVQLVKERITILHEMSVDSLEESATRKFITYFRNGGGKNNDLIELAYPLHELVDARSFYDIYIMIIALNFYWYRKVRLVENLDAVRKVASQESIIWNGLHTLKELWTRVSSKSSTRHFLPLNSGA